MFSLDLLRRSLAVSLNSNGEELIKGPFNKSRITSLSLGSRFPRASCPEMFKQSNNTLAAGSCESGKSSACTDTGIAKLVKARLMDFIELAFLTTINTSDHLDSGFSCLNLLISFAI